MGLLRASSMGIQAESQKSHWLTEIPCSWSSATRSSRFLQASLLNCTFRMGSIAGQPGFFDFSFSFQFSLWRNKTGDTELAWMINDRMNVDFARHSHKMEYGREAAYTLLNLRGDLMRAKWARFDLVFARWIDSLHCTSRQISSSLR